ncbi:hypothetical protein [Helicobacter sp. 12S02232-10]|nr:hypothetical protein [Helicobacter sp. 12S02232-10]
MREKEKIKKGGGVANQILRQNKRLKNQIQNSGKFPDKKSD